MKSYRKTETKEIFDNNIKIINSTCTLLIKIRKPFNYNSKLSFKTSPTEYLFTFALNGVFNKIKIYISSSTFSYFFVSVTSHKSKNKWSSIHNYLVTCKDQRFIL